MSPLQLFVALSELAVTVVICQNTSETAFANPPPLPETGKELICILYQGRLSKECECMITHMHMSNHTLTFFTVSLPWYKMHINSFQSYHTLLLVDAHMMH